MVREFDQLVVRSSVGCVYCELSQVFVLVLVLGYFSRSTASIMISVPFVEMSKSIVI